MTKIEGIVSDANWAKFERMHGDFIESFELLIKGAYLLRLRQVYGTFKRPPNSPFIYLHFLFETFIFM